MATRLLKISFDRLSDGNNEKFSFTVLVRIDRVRQKKKIPRKSYTPSIDRSTRSKTGLVEHVAYNKLSELQEKKIKVGIGGGGGGSRKAFTAGERLQEPTSQ